MEKFYKIFETKVTKDIDNYIITKNNITSLELMDRASKVWTDKFLDIFSKDSPIVVVAGKGNNGGDGYVIARKLKKLGFRVTVYSINTDGNISSDCEHNKRRYELMGGTLINISKISDFTPSKNSVIVDAIFGSGLNRAVEGLASQVIKKINELPLTVVSVDIPSGLMGEDNSKNDHLSIIKADYTFTFMFPKLAFLFSENVDYIGEWCILDLGYDISGMNDVYTNYHYLKKNNIMDILPIPQRFAHKGINGKGLLVAGKVGMMGAALLASRAALRSGLGHLTCHIPSSCSNIIQLGSPEAVLDFDKLEYFSEINDLSRFDAVAVGSGIGKEAKTVKALRQLLTNWKGRIIIDADALNIISENKDMFSLLHKGCILTPHIKEFERLVGKCANDFERLKKLTKFAADKKVYVVLKGAFSTVATPEGLCYFNTSGNPGMATAGAGDVLTGVLLAMIACGMTTFEAVISGVFAHGLSGDLAVKECGMRGLCAGVIADGMGKAWKILEERPLVR